VAVHELALHPVGNAVWHQFPAPGGITGLWLLAESHLTVHTFPEFGSACINLFCCTPRRDWEWSERLAELLGATEVRVRSVPRAYGPMARAGQGTAPTLGSSAREVHA
jgi:S-adenosylmethionine decarboxylase